MRKKNIDILEHIKTYCEDIMTTVERFGNDKAVFDVDRFIENRICKREYG